MTEKSPIPVMLFVDLDGTLIKTDLLVESALVLLKKSPWRIFSMILWVLKGKAHLKAEIAKRVTLEIDTLPLQEDFVTFLHEQAALGRPLYLATASDRKLAEPLAQRVGLFSQVVASDGTRNLKSEEKLSAMRAIANGQPFAYAGNARVDFPVWAAASEAIVV